MADIPAAPRRNTVISICKGIAIILMVIGHAEAPDLLTRVIYTFHMPLFFITAGYFFTAHTADDPWRFTAKRFKGLYIPFIKWSMIFLLLHNVFFHFGILNETYGNWTGGVTHPYSWKTAGSRLIHIFTDMSGYDEFIAGAFWFFRGLLVASLLFLVLYRLFAAKGRLSHVQCAALICIGAVAFTAFRIAGGYKIYLIPNGGMREIWGAVLLWNRCHLPPLRAADTRKFLALPVLFRPDFRCRIHALQRHEQQRQVPGPVDAADNRNSGLPYGALCGKTP